MNRPTIAQLEQELCGLWDLNFTLRQDAKRMDWLEAHKRPAEIYVNGVPHGCNHCGMAAATNLTLRAAIDAAIKDSK